jgi:hypothetical protein
MATQPTIVIEVGPALTKLLERLRRPDAGMEQSYNEELTRLHDRNLALRDALTRLLSRVGPGVDLELEDAADHARRVLLGINEESTSE